MKRNRYILVISLLVISFSVFAQKTKIACVGNSITEGMGASSGDATYPSVLQRNLGTDRYEVRNFGASGRTLMKNGKEFDGSASSYWDHERYQNALKYNPDIVIIKLGTNDAKKVNWDHIKGEYTGDYIELVNSFKALPAKPDIYVCYPLPLFGPGNWINDDKVMTNEMMPMIDAVARETGATIIDCHTPFEGREYLTGDKIHPNDKGYMLLAYTMAKAVCPDATIPPLPDDLFIQVAGTDKGDRGIAYGSSVGGLDITSLIDNDPKTVLEVPFSAKTWFSVELEQPAKLTAYSITSGATDEAATPVSWKVEGSTDGITWGEVASANKVVFQPNETKIFSENIFQRQYKFFRLNVLKNKEGDRLAIAEWQIFGYDSKFNSSLMDKGGKLTAQFTTNPNEGVTNLADKDVNTKFCTQITNGNSIWFRYDLPVAAKVDRYALTSANDATDRDPAEWVLYGSTDGSRWDVLDRRQKQLFVGRFSTLDFPVKSDKAYTSFKVEVTGKSGWFQLAEWQLFEASGEVGIRAAAINSNVTVTTDKNGLLMKSNIDYPSSYDVYSISGKSIRKGEILGGATMNVSLLPGVYLISIRAAGSHDVRKVVISSL